MINIPLTEHPRPQLKRDNFLCLNGQWKLAYLSENHDPEVHKITVPFSPESEASGVFRTLGDNEVLCYSRTVKFNELINFDKEILLLHFGSVDGECDIFIDGEHVLNHKGNSLPFSVEVKKDYFQLDVMIKNGHRGIWQTVWMEKVPLKYIRNLIVTPDLTGFEIVVVSNTGDSEPCTVRFGLKTFDICSDMPYRINIPNPQLWSPESPNLYFFSVKLQEDKVFTYTGLRTFGRKDGRLLLNGKPYFHHGIIFNAGYKGSLYTPINDTEMSDDITFAKKLGFNTIKLEDRIECARWYFHCDSLGMLVWQELPAEDENRYDIPEKLFNTVCTAMWMLKSSDFKDEKQLNSVIERIKQIDCTRTLDAADCKSLKTVFNKFVFLGNGRKQAAIVSRCGEFEYEYENPDSKLSKGELSELIINFYNSQIRKAKKRGLSACMYAQLTDTENEKYGLITFDRNTVKVIPEDITTMSEELLED